MREQKFIVNWRIRDYCPTRPRPNCCLAGGVRHARAICPHLKHLKHWIEAGYGQGRGPACALYNRQQAWDVEVPFRFPFKIAFKSLATFACTGSPNNPRKRWWSCWSSTKSNLIFFSSKAALYSLAFWWCSFLARRNNDCKSSTA